MKLKCKATILFLLVLLFSQSLYSQTSKTKDSNKKTTESSGVNKSNSGSERKPSKTPILDVKERFALIEKLGNQAEKASTDGTLTFRLSTTQAEELKIPAEEWKAQIEGYYADKGIKAIVLTAPNNTPLTNSVVGVWAYGKVIGSQDLDKLNSAFLELMIVKREQAKKSQGSIPDVELKDYSDKPPLAATLLAINKSQLIIIVTIPKEASKSEIDKILEAFNRIQKMENSPYRFEAWIVNQEIPKQYKSPVKLDPTDTLFAWQGRIVLERFSRNELKEFPNEKLPAAIKYALDVQIKGPEDIKPQTDKAKKNTQNSDNLPNKKP